jgi:hypothetical protein
MSTSCMLLIAVGDRRPLAKVLIAVAALASVSVTQSCGHTYYLITMHIGSL